MINRTVIWSIAIKSLKNLANAAIARVPRHRLAAARVAPVCSKREKEITSAPLIAARGHALDARCGLECCQGSRRWPNTLQK